MSKKAMVFMAKMALIVVVIFIMSLIIMATTTNKKELEGTQDKIAKIVREMNELIETKVLSPQPGKLKIQKKGKDAKTPKITIGPAQPDTFYFPKFSHTGPADTIRTNGLRIEEGILRLERDCQQRQ